MTSSTPPWYAALLLVSQLAIHVLVSFRLVRELPNEDRHGNAALLRGISISFHILVSFRLVCELSNEDPPWNAAVLSGISISFSRTSLI